MTDPNPTTEDVVCPNCDTRVTIHFSDRECDNCGANITELEQERYEAIRQLKQEIIDIVEASQFTLEMINIQDLVIRVDISAEGELTLETVDVTTADIDPIIERQTDFNALRQEIESLVGIMGSEVWYAESPDSPSGSKYGMKPDLQYRDKGEATMLFRGFSSIEGYT